jgi:hypothetical protein
MFDFGRMIQRKRISKLSLKSLQLRDHVSLHTGVSGIVDQVMRLPRIPLQIEEPIPPYGNLEDDLVLPCTRASLNVVQAPEHRFVKRLCLATK